MKFLDSRKWKVVRGNEFSVRVAYPSIIEYLQAGRCLVLNAEPFVEDGKSIRDGSYLGVYIDKPMFWRGESKPIEEGERSTALYRVAESLERLGYRYRLIEISGKN